MRPKVVRSLNQPATKVMLPDTIHNRAPGQRVIVPRQPVGQCGPAISFGVLRREREASCLSVTFSRSGSVPGTEGVRGCRDVPAMQQVNGSWFAVRRNEVGDRG